jgi:glycosyltransferase involved in cell wall biosynthesis
MAVQLIQRLVERVQKHVSPEASRREVAFVPKPTRRVLYIQFTDPAVYPPVEHSSRLLADRGWEVLILGAATRGDPLLRLPAHSRIRVRKIRMVQSGRRQKIQFILFFLTTLYWAWWWRPEWIYASDLFAGAVAWWVRRLIGVQVVYHEHDSPNLDQASTWFMRQVLAYRAKVGLEADLCVLPQQERLQRFLKTTARKKPTYCVWNCPRSDEMMDMSLDQDDRQSRKDHKLIVHYHGNIGSGLLPKELVVAASRFKGIVRIRIVGYETLGNIGYTAELIELAAKYGAAEMIEPLAARPRRDLFRLAATAHVGLSLMPKRSENINMQHMVGASNKTFDYMASGLPLLVTNLPDWVETFVKPGYARACDPDDPDSIAAELRWYMEHPDERQEMGRRGQNKIRQTWNYQSMFSDVLAEIERGSSRGFH